MYPGPALAPHFQIFKYATVLVACVTPISVQTTAYTPYGVFV